LERRVLDGNWIIEDHHHAVASEAFKSAAVLDDYFADCRMMRKSAITSSGSELSEKPVKPRRSQKSAVISLR
jgi:hypothetical protein